MTTPFLSHFTPSLMSHEALEAIFVQRESFVTRLVDLSRASVLTPAKHYTLLIGPRGIGKTHLIALLYHRLAAMADLRDHLCIAWLREDEWGVTSFLELLLRIFTALSEEYKDNALAEQVTALYDLPPRWISTSSDSNRSLSRMASSIRVPIIGAWGPCLKPCASRSSVRRFC